MHIPSAAQHQGSQFLSDIKQVGIGYVSILIHSK